MAYIGRQLARGENKLFDDISSSFNGSTTTFTLAVSSVATATATPYQLFVSLGGVMQKPNTDFTTAGNQITFTTAPAAGLSCWIMMQGDTIDNAAVADASITPSKISGTNFAFSGDLRLKDADGSHYVGFASPTTVASNKVWTLPAADGSPSQYLQTNGSGVLAWSTVSVGGATGIDFNDNVKARWGTGNDLAIYHTGSTSIIEDTTSDLNLRSTNDDVIIQAADDIFLKPQGGEQGVIVRNNGPVELYYDNVKKFETSATGVSITGALTVSTNATITGNLTVSGTTTTVDSVTLSVKDKNIEMGVVSSPSDTTADGGGITLKGASDKTFNWVNATDAWTSSEHIHLLDNKKLLVGGASGTVDGLEIVHNGSNSILNDSGTGTLQLQLGGSTKLEVTSGGINVTGAISVGGSPLASGNTVDLVADGAIAAGKPCIVTTAGKAQQVKSVLTERSNYARSEHMVGANNSYYSRSGMIFDITTPNGNAGSGDNQYVLTAYIQGSGDKVYTALGYTYSGGSAMSWTSYQVLINSNGNSNVACCGADKRWVVIAGEDQSNNGYIASYVIQVDNSNQPDAGSSGTMWTNTAQKQVDVCYDNTNDRVICVWTDSSGNGYYNVGTVNASALTINWGSVVQFVTGGIVASAIRQGLRVFWDDTIERCIICYRRQDSGYSGGNALVVRVCTIDATNQTLTVGAEQITSSNANLPRWGQGGGTVAALYQSTSASYQQRYKVGTINASAKTVTWGTEGNGPQSSVNNINNYFLAYHEVFNKYIAISSENGVGTTTSIYKGTLSGTALTWATNSTTIDNRRYDNGSLVYYRGSSLGNMGFSATDTMGTGSSGGSDDRVKLMNIYTGTVGSNMTSASQNFLGFAEDAISDTATGTIKLNGNVVGNQSGLTPGNRYKVLDTGVLSHTWDNTSVGGTAIASDKLVINRAG